MRAVVTGSMSWTVVGLRRLQFGSVGGPVGGGGALPGDGQFDVDAEQPGEYGGGQFGGKAEWCGGAALGGAESELAQEFGELVGTNRLAGAAAGKEPAG